MTRASLEKSPREVAAMFDGVARRYDLTNAVLSFGLDRWWRRQCLRALALRPGERCLDLAAGTGVSTVALSASGAWVVGCDFSVGMLAAGRGRPVPLLAGDGLALPFASDAFDAATISYGLRNVNDTVTCLRELHRVLRPGGRLVVNEFSRPTWRPWQTVYVEYLMKALPSVARAVSSNPDAYVYLAESIRAWPAQAELAGLITSAGFTDVAWRDLNGGIVALHRGTA